MTAGHAGRYDRIGAARRLDAQAYWLGALAAQYLVRDYRIGQRHGRALYPEYALTLLTDARDMRATADDLREGPVL